MAIVWIFRLIGVSHLLQDRIDRAFSRDQLSST